MIGFYVSHICIGLSQLLQIAYLQKRCSILCLLSMHAWHLLLAELRTLENFRSLSDYLAN